MFNANFNVNVLYSYALGLKVVLLSFPIPNAHLKVCDYKLGTTGCMKLMYG